MSHNLNTIRNYCLMSMVTLALGGYLPMSNAAEQDCQITTDMPIVDYGQLTYDNKVANGNLILESRDVRVNATCSRTSSFSLYFDGRKGAGGAFDFGPLGAVHVTASSASVDGKSVTLSRINKDEQSKESVVVEAGEGITPKSGTMEEVGKVFSVTLSLTPKLDAKALSARDEVLIESHVGLRLESQPLARY